MIIKKKNNFINKTIYNSFIINKKKTINTKSIGYITSLLISTSIPHSNISEFFFKRSNGYNSLKIISNPKYGLPYGIIPRIIIIWLCTEAKLNKSHIIYLGKSQNEFLKKLGFLPTGGINGTINRVKNQILKLFNSTILFIYKKNNIYKFKNLTIFNNATFFWKKNNNFWKNNISLSKEFYKNIKNTSLPIDLRVVKNIRSPLALDIYLWLTWRTRIIKNKKSILISWKKLKLQFGSNYKNTNKGLSNFKIEFLKKLKYVRFFYSKVNINISKLGIKLKYSYPHIPYLKKM